jgi:hypothetical protein
MVDSYSVVAFVLQVVAAWIEGFLIREPSSLSDSLKYSAKHSNRQFLGDGESPSILPMDDAVSAGGHFPCGVLVPPITTVSKGDVDDRATAYAAWHCRHEPCR